jgi:hypothetical protein
MNGLKLLSYIILLTVVLISRLGTELCFYNGAIDIAGHALNSDHNHCSEKDLSKNEENQNGNLKEQPDHKCCIDIKLSETPSNIFPSNNSLEFKLVCLPIVIQNYFLELQNQFALNNREVKASNNLICQAFEFELPYKNSPSFHFTSTVLLLI